MSAYRWNPKQPNIQHSVKHTCVQLSTHTLALKSASQRGVFCWWHSNQQIKSLMCITQLLSRMVSLSCIVGNLWTNAVVTAFRWTPMVFMGSLSLCHFLPPCSHSHRRLAESLLQMTINELIVWLSCWSDYRKVMLLWNNRKVANRNLLRTSHVDHQFAPGFFHVKGRLQL